MWFDLIMEGRKFIALYLKALINRVYYSVCKHIYMLVYNQRGILYDCRIALIKAHTDIHIYTYIHFHSPDLCRYGKLKYIFWLAFSCIEISYNLPTAISHDLLHCSIILSKNHSIPSHKNLFRLGFLCQKGNNRNFEKNNNSIFIKLSLFLKCGYHILIRFSYYHTYI